MRKLELQTKIVQKSMCARVNTDVDSGNAVALREALLALAENAPGVVLLDLAEVRKMDSAGIAVLVEIHDHMCKTGRRLALVNTPEPVRGMLELLKVFEIHSDLQAGIRATRKHLAQWQRLHDRTGQVS